MKKIASLYYYTIKASFFRKIFLFAHRSGSSLRQAQGRLFWLRQLAILFICIFFFFLSLSIAEEKDINVDEINNSRAADSGSVSNGKKLFLERCTVCHGKKADGNGPSAESFEVPPWNFIDGTMDGVSDGFLFQKIKNGGIWFEMPPFGLILKNDEIWDIINFLRSVSKKS